MLSTGAPGKAVTRLVVDARDAESTLSLLSDVRGAVRLRGGGERAGMRLVRAALGPVSLDHTAFGADLDVDVGPTGLLVFGEANSGAVGFRADGEERWYGQGDVYLAAQPRQHRTSMVRGGEHEQVIIDSAVVGGLAETAPGRASGPVRFTGYEPDSAQAARLWKSTVGYVRDTVLADPDAAAHPLLTAGAARLLAATALAVFPNDALAEPTATDRHDASPATLRRAVAFIDSHAHEDISVADIAAAASVTVRAVQLAFRRHSGTTPTGYLRRVRLGHAHRELAAADPGHESVTAVAYRWGFSSPSRFAAAYREAYGVPPGRTLRG
ncbi:MAG TPA: helix-turn-helix transcriptional regulator [Trebonia sp.]|nr:helix-turn-helix transcriptional regulator [Trebonia sp.]